MPQSPVEVAFVVGWQFAELRHAQLDEPAAPKPDQCLLQVHDLRLPEQVSLLSRQLCRAIRTLPGDHSRVLHDLQAACADELGRLGDVHLQLLMTLTVEDFRLGKAYAIGVELAELVLLTYRTLRAEKPDRKLVGELWNPDRTKLTVGRLRDLKSQFQPFAIDATVTTLQDWLRAYDQWSGLGASTLKTLADQRLYPQGNAWRAMLSGEKKPTDFLRVSEYATAISGLLRDYASFAREFLLRAPWLLGLLAIAVAALVGATFYAWQHQQQVQAAYAALIGVIGLFGLSTATIITAIKRALENAEEHLWYAEKAAAIALAVNWVPMPVQDSHVLRLGELNVEDPWTAGRPVSRRGRRARRGA